LSGNKIDKKKGKQWGVKAPFLFVTAEKKIKELSKGG
jgi:hypothetical protein